MAVARARLLVLRVSDSFAALWPTLARETDMEIEFVSSASRFADAKNALTVPASASVTFRLRTFASSQRRFEATLIWLPTWPDIAMLGSSSLASSAKQRPTTSAGPANSAATTTKTVGSAIQAGGLGHRD